MDESSIQTLLDECNNRGRTISAILPVYLKALSPLLNHLEQPDNSTAIIYIGEEQYSCPQMAKLIRDFSSEGIEYALSWLDACNSDTYE